MMWCCQGLGGRGDWRVIDPVWWRCDVTPCFLLESVIVGVCHLRVTFSSPPILPALFCPSPCLFFFCSQDTLSSFCQCWTRCLRDMVLTPSSTFQDAVQQWVWPRCKCAHTPGNLNGKIKNKQFIKTPKDKSIISETKVDSFQCSTLLFFSQVFVILITIRLTLFLNKAESRWRRRVQPSPFCLQWSWDLLSFRFAAEHTEQRSGRGTSCDISDNSEGSAKISLKFLCCFPHSRGFLIANHCLWCSCQFLISTAVSFNHDCPSNEYR